MQRIAVLISNAGTGSNLQAIINGVENGQINAKIAVVVSDTPDAFGLKRAIKHQLPTYVLKPQEDLTKMLKDDYRVDWVCLAGWKKIIPQKFIEVFANKIFNLHPGLIPDTFDGKIKNPDGTDGLWNRGKFTEKAIQNFLDSESTYAGSSIHLLSSKFDFGPVLARVFEKILPDDTVDSLYSRLKAKENQMYVDVLKKL